MKLEFLPYETGVPMGVGTGSSRVAMCRGGHIGPPLQRVTRLIVTRFALTQWTHDHEFIQILVLQRLMAELVVLM